MQPAMPLLADKDEAGKVKSKVNLPHRDNLPGLPPVEELRAKAAKAAADWDKMPPTTQLLPGLTLEQANAKLAAERAKKADPNLPVLPGMTQGQLDAKLAAERAKRANPNAEVLPGLTLEQAKSNAAKARQRQESEGLRPEQVLPKK